jgi:pimeloyl-ACP methyl ester carboxylesterase
VKSRGFVEVTRAGRPVALEYSFVGADRSGAPTIVFLHEGLGSVAMWRDFPARLCAAAGLRGLVYSRYGYGRSTPRPPAEKWAATFMHDEAGAMLPQLLAALRIERPWLFGHSDGASIALLHASLHPEAVTGVVVVAPHLFVEEVALASIAATRRAYETTDLRTRLARYHDDPDSAFRGWNDIWLDPSFRDWNIESALDAIACPVLAVQGLDDEYGTLAQVETIKRRLPHAALAVLPACGHSPHRDAPQALIDATLALLRRHGHTPM